ncbi:hypothetical protein [Pseudoduganella albidiflava]|uniref:Uncharacterized protein n=1 Tax=Pseudoduganella albidiflava TaxID=321983 RepID=A0A411WVT0_9BURK|nr:hypothetical protein [Pseudoduganella albidiflava]QBI00860.1 hypothetical protein EYF70_08385 [Pseudoduganella albidiflava]GGY30174.1 hypothetical protein GCM10007387_09750 [Pseudoduganella albidiflava]
MRRLFVIFLALLFPLNVFALSLSVAAHAPAPLQAPGHAIESKANDSKAADHRTADIVSFDSRAGTGLPGEALCDIDPGEPPAGMDFHDTVHAAAQPPLAAPPDASVPCFVPPWRGRDPLPPIKPPPSA